MYLVRASCRPLPADDDNQQQHLLRHICLLRVICLALASVVTGVVYLSLTYIAVEYPYLVYQLIKSISNLPNKHEAGRRKQASLHVVE